MDFIQSTIRANMEILEVISKASSEYLRQSLLRQGAGRRYQQGEK